MLINEIYRVPQSLYKGGAEDLTKGVTAARLREYFRNTKPLPGHENLRYNILPLGSQVEVVLIDPAIKTQIIADLILKPKKTFPVPNSYEIAVANVDERYRGQGLIPAMYDIVLDKLNGNLVSSTTQTPGGRKIWTRLIQDPSIKVQGVALIPTRSFTDKRLVDKTIEEIMKVGAEYLGYSTNRHYHVFAFPVESVGDELRNLIPDSKIKLYNAVTNIIKTGLIASRVGKKSLKEETLASFNVGGLLVRVDSHLRDQARDRKLNLKTVGYALSRLASLRSELDEISAGQKFWVYDEKQDLSLGIRKISPNNLIYHLKTVVAGKPYQQGALPYYTIKSQINELELKLSKNQKAKEWINQVYQKYPQTWQNNHVMMWGEGDDQELAMFELIPNPALQDTVEIKWFQAYPLRHGVGTRAMKELQSLASDAGIALTLFPWDKGQVSQAKLIKFYKSLGFIPTSKGSRSLIWKPQHIEEGWREKTAALATAATLGYGGYQNINKQDVNVPKAAEYVAQKAQPQSKVSKPFVLAFADKNPIRDYLVQRGRQAGFTDKELAHLVAQVAHETMDFKHLEEIGTPKYFARKYDKRYNPRKAKILGNIKLGDGERFKGRGFVHLTGRDNYTRAGRALGVDLVNQPQLAADPKIAADIAVWFWKNRVQPDIDDFSTATVAQVTKPINPGLRGLQDREAKFQKIVNR